MTVGLFSDDKCKVAAKEVPATKDKDGKDVAKVPLDSAKYWNSINTATKACLTKDLDGVKSLPTNVNSAKVTLAPLEAGAKAMVASVGAALVAASAALW